MKKIKNEELGRMTVEEFKNSGKTPIIIVLDNVRSALNIGSVFRTADAFLFEAIYLCGISAIPPNKEILKTALGATETVDWKYFSSTMEAIENLKNDSYKIVSVEQAKGSINLHNFKPLKTAKIALVFGHEVEGVSQQVIDASDCCLEIPQAGHKHSLNISVASGIVCWEIYFKMVLKD